MNATPPPDAAPIDRHAAALLEYQAALDRGRPIDRATFAAAYPDLPGLEDDLEALDALNGTGSEVCPPPVVEPRLDDFEIVGEIGRGGMGVVYEACHRLLGRRVALKVLPRAGADDRARRRFLHEAHVAALIEHPNVVPVFQVGETDGTPFYVMPFIDGGSLADVLRGEEDLCCSLPRADMPAYFRWVAGVGVQAAGALAAAHALGVVHRDVKPGNLLLDRAGKVFMTDFGLAAAPFGADLTRTGARPGTPRYMSPEQLAGPRDRLDARTDVYSLGVTLYELATRQPAFAGDDEAELVRQVTQSVPPPPRQVRPSVPRDLETVILKAMAPAADDRYSTAAGLADDLGRFLDGRPVHARRAGLAERLAKWVRRNLRAIGVTAATLAVGALLGLGTSTVVVWRAYRSEQAARAEADRNLRVAVAALANLSTVSGDILTHTPGLQARQLAVVQQWCATLEALADDPAVAPTVRRDIARATFELGIIQSRAGRLADAAVSFRAAVGRLEALAAANPDAPALQVDLADAYQALGQVLARAGRQAEGDSFLAAALPYATRGQAGLPDKPQPLVLLTMIRCALAEAESRRTRNPGAALAAHLEAVTAFEQLRDRYPSGHPLSYMRLASCWQSVAVLYERLGRLADAEPAWRNAVAYDDHLARAFGAQPATVRDASRSGRAWLGLCLLRLGRLEEGEPLLDAGKRELERAAREFPGGPNEHELAYLNFNLAHLRHHQGRPDAARSAGQRCQEVVRANPTGFSTHFGVMALVLLPDPNQRDPAQADRVLAESEGFVEPWVRSAVSWRAGRFQEAVDRIDDAEPAAGLIRAACLARLRRVTDAQTAFAQFQASAAHRHYESLELISLREEVGDLLAGIGAVPP